MKVYTRDNKPDPSPDCPEFSVDVITMTQDEVLNLAYFSFEDDKWKFHTDTIIDMDETDDRGPIQFQWIYPPKELFFKKIFTKL